MRRWLRFDLIAAAIALGLGVAKVQEPRTAAVCFLVFALIAIPHAMLLLAHRSESPRVAVAILAVRGACFAAIPIVGEFSKLSRGWAVTASAAWLATLVAAGAVGAWLAYRD